MVTAYLQPGPTAPEGGRKVVVSGCSPKSFDLALKPPSSDISLQGPTQFYCGGHRGKSFSTKGQAQNFAPMEEPGPIKAIISGCWPKDPEAAKLGNDGFVKRSQFENSHFGLLAQNPEAQKGYLQQKGRCKSLHTLRSQSPLAER